MTGPRNARKRSGRASECCLSCLRPPCCSEEKNSNPSDKQSTSDKSPTVDDLVNHETLEEVSKPIQGGDVPKSGSQVVAEKQEPPKPRSRGDVPKSGSQVVAEKQEPPKPRSREAAANQEMPLNQKMEKDISQPTISCDKASPPLHEPCSKHVIVDCPDGSMVVGAIELFDPEHGEKVIQPGDSVSGPHVTGQEDPLMGQPSNGTVHVFGSQYAVKGSVSLIFNKSTDGGYYVSPTSDSGVTWKFKISPCDTTLHRQLKLDQMGDSGGSVATLEAQNITSHGQWDGYSGNTKAAVEKKFSIFRGDGTDLHVALQKSSSAIDFKVKGNVQDRNCTIYNRDSSAILAKMCLMDKAEEASTFKVIVYPDVDCAFVVSLIAVVDVINSPGKIRYYTGKAIKGVLTCVGCASFVTHMVTLSS